MNWTFSRSKEQFSYIDKDGNPKTAWAWNKIRSLANGQRHLNEVVMTSPMSGRPMPYDPHLFPLGTWTVLGVESKLPEDNYLYPFFIQTDAYQLVPIWSVENSSYLVQTDEVQLDSGYGIHFSTSETTLGCIRIATEKDLRDIVDSILHAVGDIKIDILE